MEYTNVSKTRLSRILQTKRCNIIQRYMVDANYFQGGANARIEYPVGVARGGNNEVHAAHLIAHRFGGPPGGDNIVFMLAQGNRNMEGTETRVFNYINAHEGCLIDYRVRLIGNNPPYRGADITAFDLNNHNVQI